MFARAFRLARIRGVDVRLDPTLIVLAALIVWTFSRRFAAEYGGTTALVMAAVGMLLFIGSILAHELAHALEAVHRRVEVESITLLAFGGVTRMHAPSVRPRDEFAIAAVGPFVSLLCGAVFGLLSVGARVLPDSVAAPGAELFGLLALLNVLLAAFNLVPGAPLDGGRVLRAGLWWLLGDRSRAVRWAARCGQLLGLALAGFGLYLTARVPEALLGAMWYVVIGVFLFWAAGGEHRNSRLDDLYSRTTVRALLGHLPAASRAPDSTGPSVTGDGERPTLAYDADLHDLVDAFQGGVDRVVLTEDGVPRASVSEQEVARAIGRLRRGVEHVDPRHGAGASP